MCELLEKSDKESIVGYKVVAVKDNKYYSVAMGFCYNDYDKIPRVEVQKSISDMFANNILRRGSLAYSEKMIGRTAVFFEKKYAESLLNETSLYNYSSYDFEIKQAEISEDIMLGYYYGTKSMDYDIAAGRKIKFLE